MKFLLARPLTTLSVVSSPLSGLSGGVATLSGAHQRRQCQNYDTGTNGRYYLHTSLE